MYWLILLVVLGVLAAYAVVLYNHLVALRENVKKNWASCWRTGKKISSCSSVALTLMPTVFSTSRNGRLHGRPLAWNWRQQNANTRSLPG